MEHGAFEQGYKMPVKPLNIITSYNKARFIQAGSEDCANWYQTRTGGKGAISLYPAMGRRKVELLGELKLLFDDVPRAFFETLDYMYVVVDSQIIQVDRFYNQIVLSEELNLSGRVYADWLAVGEKIYIMVTDEEDVFVITEESSGSPVSIQKSTTDTPASPTYVVAFANRFIVSSGNTPTWYLSQIELGGTTLAANSTWFTIPGGIGPLFAQASGKIGQLGVLNNQLYIFTDYSVDIWANIPTQIDVAGSIKTFPFKQNTSYSINFGIENPDTLSIDFGFMVWLARNRSGLVTFMMSTGGQPKEISTEAINVLLETQVQTNGLSPFLNRDAQGFLYQWENTIFYRVTAGKFLDFGELDIEDSKNALEYNFKTQKWHRVIELNGERNRISKHLYFNNKHFVIVENETAILEMRGDVYTNDIQDTDDSSTFERVPMRYELTTEQIFEPDYSEFITDYVEIDFVFENIDF